MARHSSAPSTARPHSRRRAVSTAGEEADDLALVERARRGEREALAELLSRHENRIFFLCLRMVGRRDFAEDLAQDAMVRIIEGLASYDGRARLSTWIHRVTMNVVISKLRSEKHRRHASLDAMDENTPSGAAPGPAGDRMLSREPAPASNVEMGEERRRVAAALVRLSVDQRAILVLRDCQGLDYERIGEVLEIGIGTVKSRLFRARSALREAMEKEGQG